MYTNHQRSVLNRKNTQGFYLSSYIYGPSYLAFDNALFYYEMIPERVANNTLATYNKQKTKKYYCI